MLVQMPNADQFHIIESISLAWPEDFRIPSKRFRLFVAADVTLLKVGEISGFAHDALKSGMVYFCAWGADCERFHDIVDETAVEDSLGEGRFVGSQPNDIIMTTWHADEALEDALDFFIDLAHPTEGFAGGSESWVALVINNSEWADLIRRKFASRAKSL